MLHFTPMTLCSQRVLNVGWMIDSAETLVAALLATTHHLREAIMHGPLPQLPPHVAASAAAARAPTGVNTEVARSNDECLFYILLRRIVEEDNAGVQEQVADCIRLLIDPERMEETVKDHFLQLFYDFYIHWMFTPFVEGYDYTIQKSPPIGAAAAAAAASTENDHASYNPADPAVPSQGTHKPSNLLFLSSQLTLAGGSVRYVQVLRQQLPPDGIFVTSYLNVYNVMAIGPNISSCVATWLLGYCSCSIHPCGISTLVRTFSNQRYDHRRHLIPSSCCPCHFSSFFCCLFRSRP